MEKIFAAPYLYTTLNFAPSIKTARQIGVRTVVEERAAIPKLREKKHHVSTITQFFMVAFIFWGNTNTTISGVP
jgi:hypothetical protein